MGLDDDALGYHRRDPPGKVAIETTKPTGTRRDVGLAYSPGVAAPSRATADDPTDAYTYTSKGNLVGMVSNGSAVLGLGDIGAQASKPVIEGKASCSSGSPTSTSSTSNSTPTTPTPSSKPSR